MRYVTALALFLIPTVSLAGQQPPAPREDPDRKICRSTVETGSLVRKRKRCFTQREWDRMAQDARLQGTNIQESGTGRLSGEF